MSVEYYKIEKENNYGDLNISRNVFESIVTKSVKEIEGVHLSGAGSIRVPGVAGPLEIKVNKHNQVNIKVEVCVNYGLKVSNVISELQTKIHNTAYEMTGINNLLVDIDVKAVKF